jgi:serine protease AprX
VTVALVDTGVADVPDLAGAVTHVNVSGDAQGDGYGHGTFLAGLIAGSGSSSDGLVRGVAPAARILDIQVAGRDGSTSLSTVLDGLEAVAAHQATDPTLRIVNLSLSSGSPLPPWADPLSRALESLWDRGLVVVVAAGNDGPRANTVSSPGDDPVLLTVGALDEAGSPLRNDDSVADFSSHGRTYGVSKPEVVAPGVGTIGLRSPGSVVDLQHPAGRVGNGYFRGSGTSMAAAVTSGAAAALLGERPDLLPDEVKQSLVEGAYDIGKARGGKSAAGGVDVRAAVAAADTMAADWTPAGRDAWRAFADAWTSGSYADAQAAWERLPANLRHRAAAAFATALASDPDVDPELVKTARAWSAHLGAADGWLARAWSARAWSQVDWVARAWSARAWSARAWSARAWSARAWSARAWSAEAWDSHDWSARAWSARAWSARAWSARAWSARAWSARAWSARAWSAAWADEKPTGDGLDTLGSGEQGDSPG